MALPINLLPAFQARTVLPRSFESEQLQQLLAGEQPIPGIARPPAETQLTSLPDIRRPQRLPMALLPPPEEPGRGTYGMIGDPMEEEITPGPSYVRDYLRTLDLTPEEFANLNKEANWPAAIAQAGLGLATGGPGAALAPLAQAFMAAENQRLASVGEKRRAGVGAHYKVLEDAWRRSQQQGSQPNFLAPPVVNAMRPGPFSYLQTSQRDFPNANVRGAELVPASQDYRTFSQGAYPMGAGMPMMPIPGGGGYLAEEFADADPYIAPPPDMGVDEFQEQMDDWGGAGVTARAASPEEYY